MIKKYQTIPIEDISKLEIGMTVFSRRTGRCGVVRDIDFEEGTFSATLILKSKTGIKTMWGTDWYYKYFEIVLNDEINFWRL